MTKRDGRDAIGGLLLVLIGAAFLYEALGFGIGTMSHMGPGLFPMILSLVSIALGLFIAVPAIGKPVVIESISLRSLVAILGAIALFMLTIERFGLLPATFVATLAAAFADRDAELRRSIAVAAVVTTIVIVVFSLGLGLSTPLLKGG